MTLFCDLGALVVTGSQFLGGFVGEQSLETDNDKVKVWCKCIQSHFEVAKDDPQASFVALTRAKFKWNHIQQVTPHYGTLFAPLQHDINSIFYLKVQYLSRK